MKDIHPAHPRPATSHAGTRLDGAGVPLVQGFGASTVKNRGHSSQSWIHIERNGKSQIIAFDNAKATIMRCSGLPARDLRLLDPLFVYPSTILGREKAIVVSLEQIRCIIMADEVFLMNSLDSCVLRYEAELCQRLQITENQSGTDTLPLMDNFIDLKLNEWYYNTFLGGVIWNTGSGFFVAC